jgi:hypothetical protein
MDHQHVPVSVSLSLLLLASLAAQAPSIEWQTDLAAAQKLAAEQNAPLFVVFRCER